MTYNAAMSATNRIRETPLSSRQLVWLALRDIAPVLLAAMPFGAVAVDLITGVEVVLTKGAVIDAIRASISIPGVFTPVRMGDALLVDGGLMNTVPVSVC